MPKDDPTASAIRPSIGVVVVAYRSSSTILRCISSCLADPLVASVTVVDNSAADAPCTDVLQALLQEDSRLRYVPSANVGFSRGCNVGAASLPEEITHVAFVNPDVELTGRLSDLCPHLAQHQAAIVGGRLLTPSRPWISNARKAFTYWRSLIAASVGGDRAYRCRIRQSSPTINVPQLAGALLLMSRAEFDELSGFDERFELYYEDVDLARRAEPRGGSILVTSPFGVHLGGISSASVSGPAFAVGTISRIRFVRKWHPYTASFFLPVLGLLEWFARSLSRRSEGQQARNAALVLQVRELLSPQSVRILR